MKSNDKQICSPGPTAKGHRPDSGSTSQSTIAKSRPVSLIGITQYESGTSFQVWITDSRYFSTVKLPTGQVAFFNPVTGLPWSTERSCTRWTRKVLKKPGLINAKWVRPILPPVPLSEGHNPSGSSALAGGRVHKQTAHETLTSPTERRGMGDGERMELTPPVKAPTSRAGSPVQRPSEQQGCSSL